ncbi:hypothetical protein C8Q74DRAFT_1373214 [Fomes fomentarius]|nr:hypothetical protein C8Q74DRAFT_1373214 [Fomes fomentarius]
MKMDRVLADDDVPVDYEEEDEGHDILYMYARRYCDRAKRVTPSYQRGRYLSPSEYCSLAAYKSRKSGGADDSELDARYADLERYRTLVDEVSYAVGTEVVCNLSKREYICTERLDPSMHLGVEHALLSQICWSDDQDVSMICSKQVAQQLVHGPWAGDKFCVTTLESMPSAEGREWKDVSARANKLLHHLWKYDRLRQKLPVSGDPE